MAPMRKFCVVLIFQLGALQVSFQAFFPFGTLTTISVVGAGVAKLVVFHRIIYSPYFLIPPVTPSNSSYLSHTDPCGFSDTAAGDEDLTCKFLSLPQSNRDLADLTIDLLTPTVYWPMVESSLGIVGACLPLLRPIFTDTRAKNIFSSLRTILSRPPSPSSSARTESLEYAKKEAGGIETPTTSHKFEEALMV